jgi:hypothetical protein
MPSLWPDTHAVVDGILTSVDRLGAAAVVTAAERFLLVTVMDPLPETEPTVAVTVPPPTLEAEKVTGLPGFGEKLPSAGDTDQFGVTDTGLP